MAWTEADIAALEKQIADAKDTVSSSGGGTSRMVRNQSIESQMKALEMMKRAVRGGVSYRRVQTRKGM